MIDLTLSNKSWLAFSIGDLFEAKRPTSRKEDDYDCGVVPFIASGGINNGVTKFCKLNDDSDILDRGNCLSISPVDGSCYYHPYDFLGRGGAGSSIILLYAKNFQLNRYIALFMSKAIAQTTAAKYSYGHMASLDRIKKDRIYLPIDDNAEIDFQFMTSFMMQKEQEILKPTIEKLCKRLIKSDILGGKWKAFILSDIFTISAGKRLTKADMRQGSRPFIGATDSNNGITAWVENTNESLDSEVLGVNYNGSVVETFYHPYECIFSDDVKRLHLKNDVTASTHLMLFLKTMIIQQRIKFAYGYKFNEKRMQMQKIVLPIDSEEQPNWKYMETYMQRLEQQQIVNYLSYVERKPLVSESL